MGVQLPAMSNGVTAYWRDEVESLGAIHSANGLEGVVAELLNRSILTSEQYIKSGKKIVEALLTATSDPRRRLEILNMYSINGKDPQTVRILDECVGRLNSLASAGKLTEDRYIKLIGYMNDFLVSG